MEEKQNILSWHSQSIKDVFASFNVSKSGILSNDIQQRRDEYGFNELPKAKKKSIFVIGFDQVKNPLMMILIFAVVVSGFLGEWFDSAIISLAIVINIGMGFFEEYKADRSLYKLQLFLEHKVWVRRDDIEKSIPARELLPGDIVLLSSGDKVVADGRVILSNLLTVNEASLTGESVPQKKQSNSIDVKTAISDQVNMLFSGTKIVGGQGEYLVTAIGMKTEIGHIAKLVSDTVEKKTPFQKQMDAFSKALGFIVLGIALISFLIGIFRGIEPFEMFEMSVALAIASVPEGLVVVVTVILVIGMRRILRQDALVRKLVAAETLGSVSIICTDKTGTITTGEMTVTEIYLGYKKIDIKEKNNCDELHKAVFLTNHSTIEIDFETGKPKYHGSATENSLLHHFNDIVFIDRNDYKIVLDLPFNAQSKFSAVVVRDNHSCRVYALGAPEVIIKLCDLSDSEVKKYTKILNEMTGRGLRVLMAAERSCQINEIKNREDIKDLKSLGFIGLKDPVRLSATKSIAEASRAGVRTIMVTGDHAETARSIAHEVGIDVIDNRLVTGDQLDEMTDNELFDQIEGISVFARVLPRHKLRIIHAWQSKEHSVAMTGDGVNDAPAIKAADIGIAFGSGTEVTKETSDLVLLNNDFSTIVSAIRQGRVMLDNIRKVIIYLLADAAEEIALVVFAIVFKLPLPILATQILWINLISDGPAAVALAFEPGEKDVMALPPRLKNESLVNHDIKVFIILLASVTSVTLILVFVAMYFSGLDIQVIRTFIYTALGIDTLLYAFAIRKLRTGILKSNPLENPWLIVSVLFGFVLLLTPLFIEPFKTWFEFTDLSTNEWVAAIGLAVYELILIEFGKHVLNRRLKQKIEQNGSARV